MIVSIVRSHVESARKTKNPANDFGGGGGGGMEARVARIESDIDHMKGDIAELKTLIPIVHRIDEKLNHIPNNWTFSLALITVVLAVAALQGFLK